MRGGDGRTCKPVSSFCKLGVFCFVSSIKGPFKALTPISNQIAVRWDVTTTFLLIPSVEFIKIYIYIF
ncbi:hypothetical protein ERO13_A05G330650v2 [Gossypium hirsutum]|uniref:Uncharacterized protein n=1 Tax=Gossypium tomentosum TaxID=34277 RepID=A0A5D2QP65_GOSTO|nr:hypothetical protein ERO13_A05G330650v2 [Gossypium hirsutum]TYI30236.1 hypothetical protein ES332_A05G371800v1 [Gossypium tomentosum]